MNTTIAAGLALVALWGAAVAPPKVSSLFPAGAARGQTTTVTAAGTFERWPVRVWVDRPGIEFVAAKEKGQFTARVQPDASLGICWVRFYDEQGAAPPRPFVIGTLPELVETEPNDDVSKPQPLESSVVTLNGQLSRSGDVDTFALPLRAGQTLVASLDASRTLGSAMDASLQIVSADGFVRANNDDYHDLDPQIVWTAPSDGKYLVRTFAFPATPDSSIRFAGSGDFVYRLTLTTGGFVEYAYPLAVPRPQSVLPATARLTLCGWNMRDEDRVREIDLPATGDSLVVGTPQWASTASVRVVPHESIVEREPNEAARPQPLVLPATVTGRIDRPGDSDVFGCSARKGGRLVFRVESRSLGFPLDAVLRLTDSGGALLAEADDSDGARDPELSYVATADTDLRLEVRDLYGHGGGRYVYRLTAAPAVPGFAARLADDRFTLSPGKALEIPVTIERTNGFSDEIEVIATDLPAGVTASPVRSAAKGDTAKSVKLMLSAAAAATGSGSFRVVATPSGRSSRARAATAPIAGFAHRVEQLWLTILRQP